MSSKETLFARVGRKGRGFVSAHPRLGYIWHLITTTIGASINEETPRMAAAISYWLLVTVAPLLLFAVSLFTFLDQVAMIDIVDEISATALPAGDMLSLGSVVSGAFRVAGPFASIASALMMIWGALAVFRQLVWALDVLWEKPVPQKKRYSLLRSNGLSALFLAVLTTALTLVVAASTLLTNLAGAFNNFLRTWADIEFPWLTTILPLLLSIGVAALFFVVVFWVVPGKRVKFREVAVGALVTSVFYGVGQTVFARLVSNSHNYEIYGAFSVFVALIVFIYYMAMIVLVGTVFTREIVRDRERYGADHATVSAEVRRADSANDTKSHASASKNGAKQNPFKKSPSGPFPPVS